MSGQEYGGDDIVQVPVPRRLLPAIYRVLADGMAPATTGDAALTDDLFQATRVRKQNMIDLISKVARQLKADQDSVSLGELHNAYLHAYPGIDKGKTESSFSATVNFYTINMRSRFIDKNDPRKPAPWLSQPTFKRLGRGEYMLLSKEEIAWFRRCVAEGNSLIYKDDYDVDELVAQEESGGTDIAQNPRWSRDETILVLELYFQIRPHLSENDTGIMALSELINGLGITPGGATRSPDGVYLKLLNFEYLDPENPGRGLVDGARQIAKEVWVEFATSRERLTQEAAAIRDKYGR